jgi:PIN domain nuclease of toxin-antitoxin system
METSAISIWKIAIKQALRKPGFNIRTNVIRRGLLQNLYQEIPLTSLHAVAVESSPPLHHDPFDRILIAQAITEGITLLTADTRVSQYPGPILKI